MLESLFTATTDGTFAYVVSGEANFTTDYTGLVVRDFTQPSVARGLIESMANVEKEYVKDFFGYYQSQDLRNSLICKK